MAAEAELIRIALDRIEIPQALYCDTLAEIGRHTLGEYGPLDWETFVDLDVRALWPKLDFGQKLIAYIAASSQAHWAGDD